MLEGLRPSNVSHSTKKFYILKPNLRERLAYRIEYLVKLAYPASFLAFNLLYWSYYLHLYYASTQLHKI